jgi:hypothetical protein
VPQIKGILEGEPGVELLPPGRQQLNARLNETLKRAESA